MKLWSRISSWWNATLRRTRMDSEMDAELRFHIETRAEDLVRGGVSREEAMRRAHGIWRNRARQRGRARSAWRQISRLIC
jgi:hypothetical protein